MFLRSKTIYLSYILISLILLGSIISCREYYKENGLFVRYFSKYRIYENDNIIRFTPKDRITKKQAETYTNYFKVYTNFNGNILKVIHYKYHIIHTIRYNDKVNGRVIRFERYKDGVLTDYYINRYDATLKLVERKHFDSRDKLIKVEKL